MSIIIRLRSARCAALIVAGFGVHATAVDAVPTREIVSDRLPGAGNQEVGDELTEWTGEPAESPRPIERLSVGKPTHVAVPLFISSGYGWRNDPFGRGGRRHEGIDLPGRLGSQVYATGSGIVSYAGRAGGYGNLVQISHPGGLVTRYGHLSHILVAEGSSVSKGTVVGLMGSTGRSTGSHLHYEVRVRGVPVNPLGFVRGGSSYEPHYEVAWPRAVNVKPRWAGWANIESESRLPEASIP